MYVQRQVTCDPSPPRAPEVHTCVRKTLRKKKHQHCGFCTLAADESVAEIFVCLLCVCTAFPLMYVCVYICTCVSAGVHCDSALDQ